MSSLNELRDQIDQIDRQIHQLLNQRAVCASQIADVKLRNQDSGSVVFYRPEREAQVLGAVMERNQESGGALPDGTVAHIFREIMSACLALEQPAEVAFLGPEGTFTQQAAIKHFGNSAVTQSRARIADVFSAVETGAANYGVVPVENSTEGAVNHTLDVFVHSPLKICGEVQLPIHLQLLVSKQSGTDKIKKICGHRQALAQCQSWLSRHWPTTELVDVSSNGEAARLASKDPSLAAVAGEIAAELYGLSCVSANIEDRHDNTTRFLVIGEKEIPPSGSDKTSIVVATRNSPGALFHLLEPFHRESISLTRVDTRPSPTEKWAHLFFIEFEGHREDEQITAIMSDLEEHSFMIKVLGSYPCAVF